MADRVEQRAFARPDFTVPLVDLAEVSNRDFAGILTPVPEVGASKKGVDKVFLEDAESYYQKYQGFDYWRTLLKDATARVGVRDASCIVEFGAGFGNSTLPLLDLFANSHVIATDISPNLLAILRRLLLARNLADRCTLVAMDAHKDYIRPGTGDLVAGSAILHHLANPTAFIERAMAILKPGGSAIFFEPFEAGNAMLRLICIQILREAERRRAKGRGLSWLKPIPAQLKPQIFRERMAGWQDRNDKWAFPKSVLEEIARSVHTSNLIIYPLHDNKKPFTRQMSYMMKAYGNLEPSELPAWAWQIFDEFESDYFSPEMLTDLLIEGCVIFQK